MSDRTPSIVSLPTLDEIAERPERASQLSPAAVQAALSRALVVQAACFSALLANGPLSTRQQADGGPATDDLVSARVVAKMMGGLSPRAVYRQAQHFPFSSFTVRPTPGTVRFRRRLVEEYLLDPDAYRVRHAGAVASGPVPPAPSYGPGRGLTMARVHGQGRIFRRGRRWWIAYYYLGREVREPSRSTNAKVAERLLKDRLGAIYAGTFIGPQQARVTVADLLVTLRVEMGARGLKGWYAIKGIFPRLAAALGQHRVIDVTPDVLLRYELDLRASGLAPATRQNYFWLLKAAFRLGMRHRRIAILPEFPRLSVITNARQGFVEPEVFAEILGHLPPIGQEIAAFAYASAWRQAEVLGLTWDVVDRRGQEIRLPDTKNGRPRVLALTGELSRIFERRWAGRVVGDRMVPRVFSHRSGRPVASTTLRNWWREAAAAAGHAGIIFHDLRRSGVRNMIRAGVTEPVAMSISGHRSPAVFRRYNITTVDDQRRALAATQAYAARRRARRTDKTRTIGRRDDA